MGRGAGTIHPPMQSAEGANSKSVIETGTSYMELFPRTSR